MKPYPSVFRAQTSNLRPATVVLEPTNLHEVSNRIPPTSHTTNIVSKDFIQHAIYYNMIYTTILYHT